MKIFFEGQPYKTTLLIEWFKDTSFYIKRLKGQKGKSTLECVGYYFNASKGDHCFALPKVFFFNGKPFGTDGLEWENGIDVLPHHGKEARFSDWKIDFLYELPMKLYSAIGIYSQKKDSEQIYQDSDLLEVSSSKDKKNLSLLDITFALRDFYYEHEDLFVFIYKETHKGYNKVNWSRTVRKQNPFINGDNIVYLLVNNRRQGVNYEEELLILFFNTLRYIDNKLVRINIQDTEYELFPDIEFYRMMANGVVVRNLMEIQENYYNETLVELWDLLYKFHSKSHFSGHGGRKNDDYLLVHKFNIVFEDMIDELLHDDDYVFTDGKKNNKKQADGKIIDHLFRHKSLVNIDNEVYYVGDSKYYKDGAIPKGTSLYKQYTYAKNIVQSQIDWFYKELPPYNKYIKYRDERTEGYTITPNFFITGNVEKESTWKDDELRRTPNPKHATDETEPEFIEFERHYQFEDRLFDRDTLFLLLYDINFMFVLNAYISKNKVKNKAFFDKAKDIFREDFTNFIGNKYKFYTLVYKDDPTLFGLEAGEELNMERVMDTYFKKLAGKVFCPFPKEQSNVMILALEIFDPASATNDIQRRLLEDNIQKQERLLNSIDVAFIRHDYSWGDCIDLNSVSTEINETHEETHTTPETDQVSWHRPFHYTTQEDVYPSIAAEAYPTYGDIPEDERENYLQLHSIEASCGYFGNQQSPEPIAWVKSDGLGFRPNKDEHVVVHATGNSMQPNINDGDLCVFKKSNAPDEGDIVLSQLQEIDADFGGAYTIKRFNSRRNLFNELEEIILSPINRDEFNPIVITDNFDRRFTIIGVYKGKLQFNRSDVDNELNRTR